jgi:hypothetical protein
VFRPARLLILVSLCAAVSPLVAETAKIPPRSQTTVVQPQPPMMFEQNAVITNVPQLIWMNRDQASALLGRLHLGVKISGPEDQIVAGQDPAAGTVVKWGTDVTLTMAKPVLTLAIVNPSSVQINQDVSFAATLEPPLPQAAPPVLDRAGPSPLTARYLYQWDDNTGAGWLDQADQSHRFTTARTYKVVAAAMVGDLRVLSNAVAVTIGEPPVATPSYSADLYVRPLSGTVGSPVEATITVEPPPGGAARYVFRWGDGTQDSSDRPVASHTYKTSGDRTITAIVTIAGVGVPSKSVSVQITASPSSNTIDVHAQRKEVTGTGTGAGTGTGWPAGLWIVIVVFILGVLMIISARSKPKPAMQSNPVAPPGYITSGLDAIDYLIENPEKIRTNLTVGFRGGNPVTVTMIGSQGRLEEERRCLKID